MNRTKLLLLAILSLGVALSGAYATGLFSVPACAQGACPPGLTWCCKPTPDGGTACRCTTQSSCERPNGLMQGTGRQ
jgi:hypothetical protein